MSGSGLVINYPYAGENVTLPFVVRGTVPDITAVVKVWLENTEDHKKRFKGHVVGPIPNPGGDPVWLATFTDEPAVPAGEYHLITVIETREDLCVLEAAAHTPKLPPPIRMAVLTPSAGATISNPITVYGSVWPASCTVPSCTITVGGNEYTGTVTGPDANGNWSATFGTIPSGAATISVTAKDNGNSTTTDESVTVQ